jgi:hypothetical protein
LGEYYEPIRKFLLGGPFPQDAHIVILLHNQKPVANAALPVHRGKSGYGDYYWFYVNGLGFMLYIGEHLPQGAERQCAQHGVNGPVVVDRAFSAEVYAFIKELLEESQKSEGVLGLLETSQDNSTDISEQSE